MKSFEEIISFLNMKKGLIVNLFIALGILVSSVFLMAQISAVDELKDRVERHHRRLQQMLQWKAKLSVPGTVRRGGFMKKGDSLMAMVTRTAGSHGIQAESIEPGAPMDKGTFLVQSVKLKFKETPFDSLIKFIEDIEKNRKVKMKIVRVNIERNIKGSGVNAVVEIQAYQEKR